MDYLTFLLAVLHVHKALCAETFHDTTVKLAKNMTLECVYPSGGTLTQVEWFKVNETETESIAIFNPTYGMVIRTPYAEKVYFLNSTTDLNDMALSFHNASEADVGLYSCVLETFPQGSWEKTVEVVPSESFEGAVSWNSHVVSESGKNTTLSCELPTRQPAQRVTWEKIQAHQIDHLTSCNLSQGRGYTSRYRRRILTNCSRGATRAVLTLPHVTAWDAGLDRCSSEASTGENATFVIRLAVTDDGKTDNQYTHFVAGGAALLLLFAIIIATIIVLYNRRRRRQRAQFKESWETQHKATSNDRSPNSASQSTDGAGEDIYVNYPSFSRRPKARI